MRLSPTTLILVALTLGSCTNGPSTVLMSSVPEGVTAPKVVTKVDPEYPAELRRRGIEGTVVVEAIIDTRGIPRNVRVVMTDNVELSDLARRAVEQWRFQPGTVDGQPVDVLFNTTVNFNLNR